MKKSKSKKVLSLVMAIMMILSALPTAIFAIAADTELPMIKAFVTVNGDYHAYRKQIVTATFLDEIDTSDALYSWDVSENGDESVMAWMKVNESATADAGETRYNLFIGGDGGVFANPNSDDLFFGFEVLKEVNGLENFDTSKVETFKYTFQQCYAIEHLDLSSFDTSSARSFLWMFADCNSLETLDLTGWKTSKVTNMNSMFKNCFLITELDISSFDTCSVTDMGNMFYNCKKLTNLYVGEGWNIDNVKNGSSAFNCCEALPGYDKSKHDIGFAEEFVKPESEKPQPEKEKYTVNYEFIGDIPANVTVPTTATYEEGTTVTVETTPSADGYIFSGWTTADADITNGNFEIQNDVTIIGEWTKINYYNVEYKFEGDIPASVTVPTTATYEEGTTVTVEATPSADGYIFSGWTTSDADITNGNFEIQNDVTIIGEWTKINYYNVEYKFEGDIPANVTVPATTTYEEGATVTVATTPSAEGYIFSGWTTADADITNGSFEIQNDVTIIGKWTKINYYNVEYKFEGDIPASVTVPATTTYEEGTTVTVEATPSADGYIFSGWTTSDADITNGNFEIQNDVTIIGKWTKINYYNVEYKFEGDIPANVTVPTTATYEEGTTVTVETIPSADGYIFSGWTTADADITNGSFEIQNDVTIIGKWTKINYYNVEYKFEGNIPTKVTVPATATYEEGTTVTVETTPSVEGYIFSGWTTADADITTGSFEIQNNVTIIGKWTKINYYNVEYKFEGDIPASVTVPTTATYEEGTTVTVEATPSVEGYIFSGWTTADSDITNGSFNVYNNVVIVGKWEKVPDIVTSITAPDKLTLVLGEEKQLEAHVNINAVNKELNYVSGDENIVKVDGNGMMSTVSEGKTFIKVISVENPAIYKIVEIIVTAISANNAKHYIVFGKTDKIGWYSVSTDGGKTFFTQFGNDHLEVEKGSEIIIKANGVFNEDPFAFYVNGKAVTPDENGCIRIVVDQYLLIGALSIPVPAPDVEESLNIFQQLIKSIKDFFAKLTSIFKF